MKILRSAAVVASVLWLVAVITTFWTTWDVFAGPDTDRVFPGNRLVRSIAAALGWSWGYAVLAYTASIVLGSLRSELLPVWSAED